MFGTRPYTTQQWEEVRKAWWWHTVGMVCVPPYYSLVALTIWQQPSRQPLGRRIFWAATLTILAAVLIGIPLLVVFSRRWYWLWRTRTDPLTSGITRTRSGSATGLVSAFSDAAAKLADRIWPGRTVLAAPPVTTVALAGPWETLVQEAASARDRIRVAASQVRGPASAALDTARREAEAGVAAAVEVAHHATQISSRLAALRVDRVRSRLAELERAEHDSVDIDIAKQSLREQLATAERMEAAVRRRREQLERLVAQLGEAAARADELAVGVVSGVGGSPDLGTAVDALAAIRAALATLDSTSPDAG